MPFLRNHVVRYDFSLLSDYDLQLFKEGNHNSVYEKMGAHLAAVDGQRGTYFAVWAPDAYSVSVIGEFNSWNKGSHALRTRGGSGIWEGFIPEVGSGTVYKYHVASRYHGYSMDKADPYAFENEVPPRTTSIVWDLSYDWGDAAWMRFRQHRNGLNCPTSIYEVHLGSWMRVWEEGNRWLTYRELAPMLAEYAHRMGFTHVQLLPVMEHPFYGSWG